MLAGSVDQVVSLGTVTLSSDDVVNFVGFAGDTADSQIRVIESAGRALLAHTADQVVARFADALAVHLKGVDVLAESGRNGERSGGCRDGGFGDAEATAEGVSFDAVAGLFIGVVD